MPPMRAAKSAMRPPNAGVGSRALFVIRAAYQSERCGSKNVACSRHHWSVDAERLVGRSGASHEEINRATGAAGAAHDPVT